MPSKAAGPQSAVGGFGHVGGSEASGFTGARVVLPPLSGPTLRPMASFGRREAAVERGRPVGDGRRALAEADVNGSLLKKAASDATTVERMRSDRKVASPETAIRAGR